MKKAKYTPSRATDNWEKLMRNFAQPTTPEQAEVLDWVAKQQDSLNVAELPVVNLPVENQ